ncbi:MAG: hypothetical protein K5873_08920, partial [Treponema sp.]|nr:hypothetical protein [Treponema sp.]
MMKLSKFFKIGAVALIATSLCFVACKAEEDDDENNMLSGSNNDYSLSYDNTASTSVSRGYKTTTFKHKGSLCQITIKKEGDLNGAAMGYIWDLASTDASASAEELARAVSEKPRNFCIVGFNYNQTATNKVAYYVSRYTNVYDIQAKNFGTDGVTVNGATQKAVETEYLKLNTTNSFSPTLDSDKNVVVTVNVYEETESDGKTTTGGYVVDIYDGAITKDTLASATPKKTTT